MRIFYAFVVPVFGGRNWTVLSTASLLIPAVGIGYAVQDTTTTYTTMVILAMLCGLGEGNFASSMGNINFFFPKSKRGTALGINGGLGNLGVSVVQFVVPFIVTVGVFGSMGGEPFVPKAFGWSMQTTGSSSMALYGCIVTYFISIVVIRYYYSHKNAEMTC